MRGDEPDKKTLAAAREGDPEAFRRMVEAYQSLVYNLAYRLTYDPASAEDLAQECFLRVYRKFDRYDLSLPFRPWLVRLVFRTGLNWLRGEKRHRAARRLESAGRSARGEPQVPAPWPGPAEEAEARELRGTVRRAVAALPAEYKAVIALRYFEGLDYQATAAALGVPTGTVKIRLYRARQMLKRKLALVAQTR